MFDATVGLPVADLPSQKASEGDPTEYMSHAGLSKIFSSDPNTDSNPSLALDELLKYFDQISSKQNLQATLGKVLNEMSVGSIKRCGEIPCEGSRFLKRELDSIGSSMLKRDIDRIGSGLLKRKAEDRSDKEEKLYTLLGVDEFDFSPYTNNPAESDQYFELKNQIISPSSHLRFKSLSPRQPSINNRYQNYKKSNFDIIDSSLIKK